MRLRFMELQNYRRFRSAAIEFPDGVVAIVAGGLGRCTAPAICLGEVGTVVNQNADDPLAPVPGGSVQRCEPFFRLCINVGAVLQQERQELLVPKCGRRMEWRCAER